VPPEPVAPGEEPHPLPLLQGVDAQGGVEQLGGGAFEQLEAGQRLDDLGQRLGVVGGGSEAGPLLHRRHRTAQDGNLGGGRLVHR